MACQRIEWGLLYPMLVFEHRLHNNLRSKRLPYYLGRRGLGVFSLVVVQ